MNSPQLGCSGRDFCFGFRFEGDGVKSRNQNFYPPHVSPLGCRTPHCGARPPLGLAPPLGVDDDGPWLVAVPTEHHTHGVSIQPVDVDGVGGLTRPEEHPAVDVDAEVVGLPIRVLARARRGQNEGL